MECPEEFCLLGFADVPEQCAGPIFKLEDATHSHCSLKIMIFWSGMLCNLVASDTVSKIHPVVHTGITSNM
jgi:hypothetical protein